MGMALLLQHLHWGRGYGAAKTSAVPCAGPALGQVHRGASRRAFKSGKGAWAGTYALAPKHEPRLSFWGELVQAHAPSLGTEQRGAGTPDFPVGWWRMMPSHPILLLAGATCHGQ